MLSKYFTLILTFIFDFTWQYILPGFYCGASIVYNIMLLALILTPSFSSSLSEENAVGVRIQSRTE